jgi:hypothetical protein
MKFGLCSALHYISPGKWVPEVLVPFLASSVHSDSLSLPSASEAHGRGGASAGGPISGRKVDFYGANSSAFQKRRRFAATVIIIGLSCVICRKLSREESRIENWND